jgi:Endonuclease-reverse transcriptase
VGDRVTGLASKNGKLIYDENNGRPRAALLINPNTTYFPLTKYITRDLASAVVEIPTEKGSQRIIMASAYFPPDEGHPPPPELIGLIEYCNKNNTHIIIGCDANDHHVEWDSSDTNNKGEYLLEFIIAVSYIRDNKQRECTNIQA